MIALLRFLLTLWPRHSSRTGLRQGTPRSDVQSRRRTRQGDAELMTEKQVLGLKPAPRLEQVGDEHSERVQDRKHRSERCDDSASRRESSPDGIFGKDTVIDES